MGERHMMNTSEFWTKMPLTSIAINDKRFKNIAGNNWAGAPQGLTIQRAIRALERYGHLGELTLVGRALTEALLQGCGVNATHCHFPQQIDPFTATPQVGDGYGPMILSLLELTGLRVGIVPRAEQGLFWSGISDNGVTTKYVQRLGKHVYQLDSNATAFTAARDEVRLFTCTSGVRVVTDLAGVVTALRGIDNVPHAVVLTRDGLPVVSLNVHPNEQWSLEGGDPKLVRSVPFVEPHGRTVIV